MEATIALEELVALENWELARQYVVDEARSGDESAIRFKEEIEVEFQVDLADRFAVADLPVPTFKRLTERLLEFARRSADSFRDELHQKICVEMKYCENKDKGLWKYSTYAAAIADIFGTSGAASLAVLLTKEEFLKKLCGC